MSIEHVIPKCLSKLEARFGGSYTFALAGNAKTNRDLSDAVTVQVRGILVAQSGSPIPKIHARGSVGKTTAYRLYTADATVTQLNKQYSVYVDETLLYAVETIRQPIATIGVWVVSLSA